MNKRPKYCYHSTEQLYNVWSHSVLHPFTQEELKEHLHNLQNTNWFSTMFSFVHWSHNHNTECKEK